MENTKWVAGWGAAISHTAQNYAEYFKDQTFRYVFFPTIDGSAVRLHFSNRYSSEDAVITKIFVAKSLGGDRIDVSTSVPVTFGGKTELVLPAGIEDVVSDPIAYPITAGENFAVSMYFRDLTLCRTGHSNNGHYIKKYFGHGDHAEAEAFPLEVYGEDGPYLFLHTMDFLASEDCSAIIAYGDSITAQPWPDCFAHRLYDMGIRNRTVVRKGIGGSRVLKDYPYRIKMHWGEKGITRFERDIVQSGADRVFILHGINDLIHPGEKNRLCPMSMLPTAEEMIEQGYKTYIKLARKHGLKVYLATILPCPRCMLDTGIREEIRCKINEWIRTTDLVDGVIDFEAAVWMPEDHKQILPEYDSGDHLHPSLAGASKMAHSIPEEFFRG